MIKLRLMCGCVLEERGEIKVNLTLQPSKYEHRHIHTQTFFFISFGQNALSLRFGLSGLGRFGAPAGPPLVLGVAFQVLGVGVRSIQRLHKGRGNVIDYFGHFFFTNVENFFHFQETVSSGAQGCV